MTYHFGQASAPVKIYETLMVVVTSGAEKASLPRAFIEVGWVFESLFFRKCVPRCVHCLLQEVQVTAEGCGRESLVLRSAFLR